MTKFSTKPIAAALALALMGAFGSAGAATFIQCPGDLDADAIPEFSVDTDGNTELDMGYDASKRRDIKCMHLSGSDGFISMAEDEDIDGDTRKGRRLYMFSFADVTGVPEAQVIDAGTLAANFSAPTVVLDQGQEFYLTLSNVGMQVRPDLFDPHTVHFHGFPNASDIFDGVPEATISINQGASLTYYYNIQEPGTHMYHCHVEATEHMQMGMLGNLYVRPAQNKLKDGTMLGTYMHTNPDNLLGTTHPADDDPTDGDMYVYNDGDGATLYDVEAPIQIGSFDGEFHQASEDVQALPFADMEDRYPMLNGRGYPDSANSLGYDFPATPGSGANPTNTASPFGKLTTSQPVSSLITVNSTGGENLLLLRISNLNITNFYTLTANGLTMKVVGTGARILRGGGEASGLDRSYDTSSVTLGGGEAVDVIIDVTDVALGTYFLYTTNLNFLSNDAEDFGGMMTEIEII
jgi:FtsP/CotA-like multicopper oxidase with cupredoxin domain